MSQLLGSTLAASAFMIGAHGAYVNQTTGEKEVDVQLHSRGAMELLKGKEEAPIKDTVSSLAETGTQEIFCSVEKIGGECDRLGPWCCKGLKCKYDTKQCISEAGCGLGQSVTAIGGTCDKDTFGQWCCDGLECKENKCQPTALCCEWTYTDEEGKEVPDNMGSGSKGRDLYKHEACRLLNKLERCLTQHPNHKDKPARTFSAGKRNVTAREIDCEKTKYDKKHFSSMPTCERMAEKDLFCMRKCNGKRFYYRETEKYGNDYYCPEEKNDCNLEDFK